MISFTLQQSPKLANDKQAPLDVNNAVIKTKITDFGSLQVLFRDAKILWIETIVPAKTPQTILVL